MAKIKYTKNELKRQKDNLKRFTRYLPTLELKSSSFFGDPHHSGRS
jgi:V/A-type H+-transporting ATPase subunit D